MAGDEAADFALALAWDRLCGRSLWLPSQWQPDVNMHTSEMTAIRLLLGDVGFDLGSADGQVQLTTTSLDTARMTELVGALDTPLVRSPDLAGQQGVVVGVPRFDSQSVRLLAIADQFDQQFTVPVRKGGDSVAMMMPSPSPAVENPDLASSAEMRWHVDLELLPSAMPPGARAGWAGALRAWREYLPDERPQWPGRDHL